MITSSAVWLKNAINTAPSNAMISSLMNSIKKTINPLNPHDAIKHHFTSLKTYFIFLQPRVLE